MKFCIIFYQKNLRPKALKTIKKLKNCMANGIQLCDESCTNYQGDSPNSKRYCKAIPGFLSEVRYGDPCKPEIQVFLNAVDSRKKESLEIIAA